MANTEFSDVFVPRPFSDTVKEMSVWKNALITSGAVQRSPLLDALAGGPGSAFDIPYLTSIAYGDTEGVVSTDQSGDLIEAKAVTGDKQMGSKLSRNWAISTANIISSSIGTDVLEFAANDVASMMARADQNTALAILKGVFANNAATTPAPGDMIVSGPMSSDLFIDGAYTMSDSVDDLAIAVMHPSHIASLKKQDLALWGTVSTATGLSYDTYMGLVVIADMSLGFETDAATGDAISYLLGRGALSYGEANLGDLAARLDRNNAAGNGRGIDTLHYSRDFIIHPQGFSLDAAMAGSTPSNGELELGVSWERKVVDRRSVKMVKIIGTV